MTSPSSDLPACATPLSQRSPETTTPPTTDHGESTPSINDNTDAAPLSFAPTGPRTTNPFANRSNWQTLGFENPKTSPKRDASFVPVGGREERIPTPPTMTSKQYVAPVKAAWQGSEVFNARHETLAEEEIVFEAV